MSAIKRPTDDQTVAGQPAKRFKNGATPGTPSVAAAISATTPTTPGLMGPPGTNGGSYTSTSVAAKSRKDEGLDAGDPNDMFAHVGINLQDEERNMVSFDLPANAAVLQQQRWMQAHWQQQSPVQQQQQRMRMADLLDRAALTRYLNKTLEQQGLRAFEPDVHTVLGLALTERLSSLLHSMTVLSKHRTAPPPAGPGLKQHADIGQKLRARATKEAIEEEKRRTVAAARRHEEELRRKELEEAGTTAGQRKRAQTAAAKGLSESTMARNANATANLMLNTSGGKKYSWMTGGANTSQMPRRQTTGPGAVAHVFKPGSQEEMGVMSLKDFIAAAEGEGEAIGRGGRALLKAYTMLKD